MTWLIDVMMGFAFGYLYAFLKYKKGVLDFIKKREMEDHKEKNVENIREIRHKARRKP